MAQLGLGLGLTKGGVTPFNPLSLDPYLFFDAQTSMIGTLENPTLDLDPALPETLDVITATRAGVATYTDADGLIQSASANTVRVDQTQGAELTPTKFQRIKNTDYFSSPNFELNTTLQYVTGPTGELDAVRITEDATTDYHYLAMRADVVSGTTYAISFYIKEGSYSTARVFTQSAYITKNTAVDFSAETASNGGIMENVGDGWYRVTMTGTALQTGTMIVYATVTHLNSYAGDVNNFTDYYGFQIEEGTTASDFVANTTGSPKFITGATYGPRVPMILVEPSSENLVEYSEDFSNSYWQKVDVTVAAAPVAAPDGTMTASHVVSTGSNAHLSKSNIGATNTHKTSIWARTVSGSGTCFFNYHSGTPSTITEEWQRFEVSSNTAHIYPVNFRGTSTLTEIYIWGAQLETGSVATSYIPTSGSTVTRAADDLVISGSAFSDFYNQSEGTFYVESVLNSVEAAYLFDLTLEGSGTERILLHNTVSQQKVYIATSGSGASVDKSIGGRPPAGELSRVAMSYKTNNVEASLDGVNMVPDLSATIPTTINKMTIGNRYTNPYYLNGHLKRFIFWPVSSDSL